MSAHDTPLTLALAIVTLLVATSITCGEVVIVGDVAPSVVASWGGSSRALVGYHGSGSVEINSGDALFAEDVEVGYLPGSAGEVTVTGSGSELTSYGEFDVGYSGSGLLTVEEGGRLGSENGYLGRWQGSSGLATITGSGSQWNIDSTLRIGAHGLGVLQVTSGGLVTTENGYVGRGSLSTGSATISGQGSLWANSADLYVGNTGQGSLTVDDGGQVTTATLWASLGDLHGDGSIVATTGAVLDADLLFDQKQTNQASTTFGSGGEVTVTAAGAALGAGYLETGSLTISRGVAITSSGGFLGYFPSATGSAVVTGNHTHWDVAGILYVGHQGAGSLTVEDRGRVSAETLWASVSDLAGDGDINVTSGAVLDADLQFDASTGVQTEVGFGSGGTMSVTAGGGEFGVGYRAAGSLTIAGGVTIPASRSYLGHSANATGAATITGVGSHWDIDTAMYVGLYGDGEVLIEQGGLLTSGQTFVGHGPTGSGRVTVRGAGAHWVNDAQIFLDRDSALLVESGGVVTTYTAYVGHSAIAAEAVITGAGSRLDATIELDVGIGGTLLVEGGGAVSSGYSAIGGAAIVTGADSRWTLVDQLTVGDSPGAELRIEAGGVVTSGRGYLGFNPDSSGAVQIVGPGSSWAMPGALVIGYRGDGDLTVTAGGRVASQSGTLGSSSDTAGHATLSGSGSRWDLEADLFVGVSAGGTITITDGALVQVGGELTIDPNDQGDSSIRLQTGGRLAVRGEGAESLPAFLDLINGADALYFYNAAADDWSHLADAVIGEDFSLQHFTQGELAGYTLLTVGLVGDYNHDGVVNAADYTVWRDGLGGSHAAADYDAWVSHYGEAAFSQSTSAAQVPTPAGALSLAWLTSLWGRRRNRGRPTGGRSVTPPLVGR